MWRDRQILVEIAAESLRRNPTGAGRRLILGGAAEKIRHPGAEVLKGNVVDLAPEHVAVAFGRRRLNADRVAVCSDLASGFGSGFVKHQIVKPVRRHGEVEEIQR